MKISNEQLKNNQGTIFTFVLIISILLIIATIFSIVNSYELGLIYHQIQNKTLESNQTLAYELGYSNGYYQCVEEVQQLQEEGKL